MSCDVLLGDCLAIMKSISDGSVDLVVTSPPYNIGKEYEQKSSLDYYLQWQNEVIQECVRILKPNGSICWQVGNYIENGSVYPLDCVLFPFFIKQGLLPRNRIIWRFGHGLHCKKRFSGRHETILWFTKGSNYEFYLDEVRIPQKYPGKKHYKGVNKGELSCNPLGKNPEDVWDITNVKSNHVEKTAHPCQFPVELPERLIKALCPKGGMVLDPFMGSGTTGIACIQTSRKFIGIEKDVKYYEIAKNRISNTHKQIDIFT